MVATELIDAIRGLLAGRPTAVAAEVLALEYARHCREVNGRLGKIALMLEGGGEIQALQLAGQPPPVVDAALALSFGGESAWLDFCHDHGHEVAPVIDARSLELLLALQAKGLASNHPLYRDYRAAVSSRDDERAHHLIRIIARLNPGDGNAAKELKRLQRKSLQAALAGLRDQLEADPESLLGAMRKVEEAGVGEDYETLPEWRQAVERRNRIHQSAAWLQMPGLLQQADRLLADGAWRQAAVLHGEFTHLATIHGFNEATAGLAGEARAIGEELDHHRAEATRLAEVRHLLAAIDQTAAEVFAEARQPNGLTPANAARFLDELSSKLRQHEALGGDFPEDGSRQRATEALAILSRALETAKRRSQLRWVVTLTPTAVLLLTAAAIGTLVWRASSQASLLAALRSRDEVGGAREVVTRIRHDERLLLKFPRLASEVAQTALWLTTVESDEAVVGRELNALETARREHFEALASADLQANLRAAEALVAKLPGELRVAAKTRLSVVRNEGERVLAKRQQQNDESARALAARLTTELEGIDLKGPVADAARLLAPAAKELAPALGLASATSPVLGLPAETAAQLESVAAKVRNHQEQVTAVTSAQTELANAETTAAYRQALSQLASCGFAEGSAAKRVLAAWRDDGQVRALLVFRGDLKALEAATGDTKDQLPMPAEVTAKDREIIDRLTTSEALNNLWEVVWKNGKGVQFSCLSRGQVERNGQQGWKGQFTTYPQLASTPLKFKTNSIPAAGGNLLAAHQPTATSAMMAKLKLADLLNPNGINFRASVLPLLDRVANDAQAKPLAKAYVLGQLFDLVENHPPAEWGLHYCPGLVDEIKAFRTLELKAPVSETAWLLAKEPDGATVWKDFFAARGHKWGYQEMRLTREAAAVVLHHELRLAGRVAADGAVVLTPATDNQLVLTVCDAGDGRAELRVGGIVPARAKSLVLNPPAVPYSPLLTVDLTDELQAFLMAIHQPRTATQPPPPP